MCYGDTRSRIRVSFKDYMNDNNTFYHNHHAIIFELQSLQAFLQEQVVRCNQDLHSVIVPCEVAYFSILNIVVISIDLEKFSIGFNVVFYWKNPLEMPHTT